MTSELKQRLIGLTTQLSETLMTAAILVDEFRTILQSEPDDPAVRPVGAGCRDCRIIFA
jgi:hypothetical protein